MTETHSATPSAKEWANEKVRIMIQKSRDKHAVDPVPVSCQGRQWTIKRGATVEVPRYIAKILEDATETYYDEELNEETGEKRLIPREAQAYPFSYMP